MEAGERHVHILEAGVGVVVGLMHIRPRALGLSRTETQLPYWRFTKGDAKERGDVVSVWHRYASSADWTAACLHNEVPVALGGADGDEETQEEDRGKEKHGALHDEGESLRLDLWS